MLFLSNEIHKCFEDKRSVEVRAVFLDISKAFDKVWHKGLLFKLQQNGVCGPLLGFFESYLNSRYQRVVLDGHHSDYSLIDSGVPQGSVLGPLLFLIYINDLELNILSNVKFFADDTMLYSIVNDPIVSARELNVDLELIRKWAYQWKLEFNPDPSKQASEITFSCKKKQPYHPPLFFNGNQVSKEDQQKHLGLTLDSNLSFKKHLCNKISKAKKVLGTLKPLSRYLPTKTLDLMYKSFVRPHLDYCDIIYHEPSKEDVNGQFLSKPMEDVEKVQYKAALLVSGAWKGSNRTKLYEELGWESLSDRRRIRRILQLYKIANNNTPRYLTGRLAMAGAINIEIAPPVLHNPARFNATNRYRNSFFPNAINEWNHVLPLFPSMPSFPKLKSHLNTLFRPEGKSFFDIHDRLGIRYLFQLRIGLSVLKSHKKKHNFADTPNDYCTCGTGVEDIPHFLFTCPRHAVHRGSLAASVIQILAPRNLNHLINTPSIFLYGHRSLSVHENKAILKATIKYIKETNRFSDNWN